MSTLATDAIDAAEQPTVVRGILVMPSGNGELHVKNVYLFTLALPGRGVHLDPDAVEHLVGSRRLELHRLHDGGNLLDAVSCCSDFVRLWGHFHRAGGRR